VRASTRQWPNLDIQVSPGLRCLPIVRLCRETRAFFRHHPLVCSGLIKIFAPGEWPPYSPDLNLIENLMAAVKTEVCALRATYEHTRTVHTRRSKRDFWMRAFSIRRRSSGSRRWMKSGIDFPLTRSVTSSMLCPSAAPTASLEAASRLTTDCN
jgi:hypothetical protein